ncbi:MAG: hypothetical protein ACKN9T_06965 [Candidatus Methylumidiphilus sp.]
MTMDYVAAYAPEHSGKRVTAGLGEAAFVQILLAGPFQAFSFEARAASV